MATALRRSSYLKNNISLQLASNVAAEIALRAAGDWAADLLIKFNLEQGTFMKLIEDKQQKHVCRTLSKDVFRGSLFDQYLDVRLSARGEMVGPVASKFDGASMTLAKLKPFKALVRGMELKEASKKHAAFIESNWTYRCFYVTANASFEGD